MKLSKTYQPSDFESEIYSLWEAKGAFQPAGKGQPFTMVMPPPNANAGLHVGHVLVMSIEDTVARFYRMQGRDVAWIPGADHAGFETQVVYEKHLAKEGKSRFDFTREQLYDQIFEFVSGNREKFNDIFRTLGASVDWSNFHFTLDQNTVDVAYSTFKKLWDDGLIYRGERLVNYCTHHRTGFADIEVEYEEQNTSLYYMQYGPFELATTRPETKFGDTAVAVHPEDQRYQQYIGQTINVEGLNGSFELRVVGDEMVDPEFGTGVVKITPAHDFNDWEVAQRHNLEPKRVINHDGTMNHEAGKYAGMSVKEAREAVAKDLKEKGLLTKVDDNYKNRVGKCYKCGTQIEPMLLDQWFVDMKKLAEPAIAILKEKKIEFFPSSKRQQTIEYLENVRDWNISRQIAWGIPIPAFQNVDDPDEWIFDAEVESEIITREGKNYRRDPDVFDTWFSSGQWPFVATGYPNGKDFKNRYPTDLMETGVDILYQWVARMICLGLFATGEIPFKQVYLHGMVRSEDGTKMSKSKGNVVDPGPIIQEFGTDALRLGIISGRSAGYSAAYDPSKIVAGRNFCNKLWNIARFIENLIGDQEVKSEQKPNSEADFWILGVLEKATSSLEKLMLDYRISEAYEVVYHTIWDSVADWYIEANKAAPNPEMLVFVLDSVLRLAHPFAPFVTETIWQTLNWTGESILATQSFRKISKVDKKRADNFDKIRELVSEIRNIKAALNLAKPNLYYQNSEVLEQKNQLISGLAGLSKLSRVEDGDGLQLSSANFKAWLDVDFETRKNYAAKLEQRIKELGQQQSRLQGRLENKSYTEKAPKELVEQTRAELDETTSKIEQIKQELKRYL